MEEIERKRAALREDYIDQLSQEYKDAICQIVRDSKLCAPAVIDRICEEVIKPNSDVLWSDGCAPPLIENVLAKLNLKGDVTIKLRQPYSLSKFDEARVSYHIEEQLADGKLRKWEPWEPMPPMVTPVFIVEKKGSLLGRMVGDFSTFNKNTEDYFWPAPDAEAVMMRAIGKEFHTTLDCV